MTIAEHEGIVVKSEIGEVTVQIEAQSACSSCEAHGKCGFAESKAKEIAIRTKEWQEYKAGDRVSVGINKSLGLKAAAIAYILPGALMIAVFIVLNHYVGDLWSAIATLAFIAAYWGILALCRNRLQGQFTFKLSKTD
jgi:positive regulator of sigma E activity